MRFVKCKNKLSSNHTSYALSYTACLKIYLYGDQRHPNNTCLKLGVCGICLKQSPQPDKEPTEASTHGPVYQLVERPQRSRQESVERKVLQHIAHVQHELDHPCHEARNGRTLALDHMHHLPGIAGFRGTGKLSPWTSPPAPAETG